MRTAVKLALLTAVGLSMFMSGCANEVESEDEADVTADQLVVRDTVRFWPGGVVPVCWTSTAKDAAAMEAVRNAVTKTWAAAANLTFTGWGPCPPDPSQPGVRIGVRDDHGQSIVGEYNGPDRPTTMWLNFTFKQWVPLEICRRSDFRLACTGVSAVHEFGHAIGFTHERPRAQDMKKDCAKDAMVDTSRPDGKRDLSHEIHGPYDPDSVLNYCNERWNNYGQLSAGDIAGVQRVYGRRP